VELHISRKTSEIWATVSRDEAAGRTGRRL
jgi:hypothetical protein